MRPGKRPQSDLGPNGDVKVARCKRSPPPSPGIYAVPPFAGDLPQNQMQAQRPATPLTGLMDALEMSDEDLDVQTLAKVSPDTERGAFAVEACVQRSVFKVASAMADRPAALEYFEHLRSRIERADKGLGRGPAAHDAMVRAWQRRMTGWLGHSIRSAETLAVVLEQLIMSAQNIGGLVGTPQLLQILRQTVETVTMVPDPDDMSPPAVTTEAIQASEAHDTTASNDEPVITHRPASTVEADHDHVTPSNCRAKSETPAPTLQEKFPDTRSLFTHHARKAKRKHLGDQWKDKATKRAALANIDEEWDGLPHSMHKVWDGMRASVLNGDEYLLKPDAASHLFVEGRACTSRAEEDIVVTASGVQRSDPDSELTTETAKPSSIFPLDAPFKAIKVWYHQLQASETKIYLRLGAKVEDADIIKACRAILGGFKPETETSGVTRLRHSIFVVSFRHLRAARSLAYSLVSVPVTGTPKRRGVPEIVSSLAWPYPRTRSLMFVASIECQGSKATQPDMIFHCIASCFPHNLFHLRRETTIGASKISWLLMFQHRMGFLRFTVPMVQGTAGWKNVDFEPVTRDSACPVCTSGHPAQMCDLLTPMLAKDLGIPSDHPQYLAAPPPIPE